MGGRHGSAGREATQRGEYEAQIPECLLARAFDALPGHVAIVDRHGTILGVNAAWLRFGQERGIESGVDAWIGTNYLQACGGDGGNEEVADGLVGVLEGRLAEFTHEYPCHDEVERHWYVMHVSPIPVPFGVEGAVIVHSASSISKLTELELERAAMYDALTMLPNRSGFDRALAGSGEATIAGVIFVDLDRLKHVNDALGHPAGDRLLSEMGQRLQTVAGSGELVARIGGDEFAIVARSARDREEVVDIAHRVRAAMEDPFDLGSGRSILASASIGVAVADRGQAGAATLLRDADTAMSCSKRRGRGQIVVFDPEMGSGKCDDLALETGLRRAVAQDEFRLCFQPQCSLSTGATIGYEALVRWQRPGVGLVMPDHFIPTAEDSDVINLLGAWVLEHACLDVATRRAAGFLEADLSVNVSPRHLASPSITAHVVHALSVSGLDPDRLILEITESAMLDHETVRRRLAELRGLGVRVAIDDFGVGNTSLAYLRDLEVDILKLDRSFIGHLGETAADTAIVRAVVDVAEAVGLVTVAEGIETEAQHYTLLDLGCAVGQGYLYGRPASAPARATVPHARDATPSPG